MIKTILSSIWAKIKKWVILGVIIVLGLFGYKACRKHQQDATQVATNHVLQPNQTNQITVDSTHHTITVVTPNGTTTNHLSDTTVVTTDNHGAVTIYNPSWDFKMHPYLGVGGDLDWKARIHTGVDFIGFRRLELGAGLVFNATSLKDTRVALNLGYNFYSNTSVALSIDNHRVPGLFLKVRF